MAERCCMGRDSSCVVNGLQQSTGKFVDEPCYCDEGCLDTGDCCSDYKQICDVQGKTFFYSCKFLLLNCALVLRIVLERIYNGVPAMFTF